MSGAGLDAVGAKCDVLAFIIGYVDYIPEKWAVLLEFQDLTIAVDSRTIKVFSRFLRASTFPALRRLVLRCQRQYYTSGRACPVFKRHFKQLIDITIRGFPVETNAIQVALQPLFATLQHLDLLVDKSAGALFLLRAM